MKKKCIKIKNNSFYTPKTLFLGLFMRNACALNHVFRYQAKFLLKCSATSRREKQEAGCFHQLICCRIMRSPLSVSKAVAIILQPTLARHFWIALYKIMCRGAIPIVCHSLADALEPLRGRCRFQYSWCDCKMPIPFLWEDTLSTLLPRNSLKFLKTEKMLLTGCFFLPRDLHLKHHR